MRIRPSSFTAILEDIRQRLRPAVPEMPEPEFNDLTARMAEVEMKYRAREAFVLVSGTANLQRSSGHD
jgi:hypothetical protein